MQYNRRHHSAPLMMGNGDYSMTLAYDLERRLREAIDRISGMQQPPDPTVETSPETRSALKEKFDDYEYEIGETARDIFAALTGLKIIAVEPINSNYSTGLHIRGLWPKT